MADTLLHIADEVLFLYLSISGIILFILAMAAAFRRSGKYPEAPWQYRYVVLVPQEAPELSFNYPPSLMQVMRVDSWETMAARIHELDASQYDGVIVLSEVERISPDFMQRINNAFHVGAKSIQLHHGIEPRNSLSKRLAAIHEEISQFLFRQGATGMGCSSALDGCDMVLNLKWAQSNWKKTNSNLELRLLKQMQFIEYLDYVSVYSASPRVSRYCLPRLKAISRLPAKVVDGAWSYVGKIIQQFVPAWYILIGVSLCLAVFFTFYNGEASVKWWLMVLFLTFTCCLAIPDCLVEKSKKSKKKNHGK